MSDLTITHAGQTISQSREDILTAGKKLNQMNVDFIDVSITLPDDASMVTGDVMFLPTKIEDALAVKGGSGILQSITAIMQNHATEGSADGTDVSPMNLFITSDATTTGFSAASALASAGTAATSVINNTCGFISVTNMTDVGRQAVGCKLNIGMVVQAESDSRDLYVWGTTQGTDDHDAGTLVLRFGIVQD
jgi:hypothetical protein